MTDGTAAGTRRVVDLNPGPASGVSDLALGPLLAPRFRVPARLWEGRLVFAGSDGESGLELWATSAHATGAVRLRDIHVGPGASSPMGFAAVGDRLFFSATDGVRGWELWTLAQSP